MEAGAKVWVGFSTSSRGFIEFATPSAARVWLDMHRQKVEFQGSHLFTTMEKSEEERAWGTAQRIARQALQALMSDKSKRVISNNLVIGRRDHPCLADMTGLLFFRNCVFEACCYLPPGPDGGQPR